MSTIDLSKVNRKVKTAASFTRPDTEARTKENVIKALKEVPLSDIEEWLENERKSGRIISEEQSLIYQEAIEKKIGEDISLDNRNRMKILGYGRNPNSVPGFLLGATALGADLYLKGNDKIRGKINDVNRSLESVSQKINRWRRKLDSYIGNSNTFGPENNLDVSKFVVFIPQNDLPDNFVIQDNSVISENIMTKILRPEDVMSIQVVDQETKSVIHSLHMLVNPSSMVINKEKSFSEYITRSGGNAVYWGNKISTLNFEGKSGGFYGLDEYGSGYGIGFYLRTLSFKNIASLISFYKNNGYFYRDPSDRSSSITVEGRDYYRSRDVEDVGLIVISYRGNYFIGSFDSFELSFSDQNPLMCNYSFDFTVFESFEL